MTQHLVALYKCLLQRRKLPEGQGVQSTNSGRYFKPNQIKSSFYTPHISKRTRGVYSVKKQFRPYVKIKFRKLELFTSLDKV